MMSESLREKLLSVIPQEEVWRVQDQVAEWLKTVDTGPDQGRDEFRRMLIILVNEPGG
ncbi:hypothetical protein LCGC14_1502670 [marine sediment metagenome]|uniref:Uncharacterized protein n=1 Tax=marine sediment metagenome TaxID=412755 RepID=A0A0F9JPJ1_9ZZZZ